MHITPVDPRDSAWTQTDPTFRVILWEPPPDGSADSGWSAGEYDISNADVIAVLDWGRLHRPRNGHVTVDVVSDAGGNKGTIRLADLTADA